MVGATFVESTKFSSDPSYLFALKAQLYPSLGQRPKYNGQKSQR